MSSLGLIGCEDVAGLGNQDQLGVGDSTCDQSSIGGRHELVALAMDHERGHSDLVQPAVGFPGHDSL